MAEPTLTVRSYQTRSAHPRDNEEFLTPKMYREQEALRKFTLFERIRIRKVLWKTKRIRQAQKPEINQAWKTVASQAGFKVSDAKRQLKSIKNSLKNQMSPAVNAGGTTWEEIKVIVDMKYRNSIPPEYWLKLQWLAKEVAIELLEKKYAQQQFCNFAANDTYLGGPSQSSGETTATATSFESMQTAARSTRINIMENEKNDVEGNSSGIFSGQQSVTSTQQAKPRRKRMPKMKNKPDGISIESAAIPTDGKYEISNVMGLPVQIKLEHGETEEKPQHDNEWTTAWPPPGKSQQQYLAGEDEVQWRSKITDKLINLYISNLGKVSSELANMVDKKARSASAVLMSRKY